MIDEIRTYVKNTVFEVDKTLRWDGYVFGTEVNSTNAIDKQYKIVIGDVSPALIDTTFRATVPVLITIYKGFGVKDSEAEYNQLFCKGIDIVTKAMDKSRVEQTGYIKNVIGTTLSPNPVDDNDNMMQVTLQLDMDVYFTSI